MTVTIDIFKPPKDDTEAGKLLASEMPSGRAWDKKNDSESDMNKLVRGLASPFMQAQQKIFELAEEFNINKTQNLLEDWEISVGIPDDCVFVYSDIEDRRGRVIQRLRKTPVVSLAEVQEYIDAFFVGYTVTIETAGASTYFPYTFPMTFIGNTNKRFIIVAGVSGGGDVKRLQCLLRAVIPANVVIFIDYESFSFFEDPDGLGFGTEDDPDVGGNFANI